MTWRVVDVDPATTTGDRVVVLERGACVVVVRWRADGRASYAGRGMAGDDVRRALCDGADGDPTGWVSEEAAAWIARRLIAA